jgi:phosphoadenosine phosphosulfate reductase
VVDGDAGARAVTTPIAEAERIIAWGVDEFGLDGICVTASMADAVLVSLASNVAPGIEVVFCDTQYHFPETLQTAERIERRHPIRLTVLHPDRSPDELWRTDVDACCAARKVEPLDRHLAGKLAWISGVRRADSASRAEAQLVETDHRGLVKINPLVAWTDDDVAAYIESHDVIVNPLLFDGYGSVGCWPCTRRIAAGEDARAGRWAGLAKTECGLHAPAGGPR